jgi:hypothetical protein
MSTRSKEDLKRIIESITEEDIEREYNKFSKEPKKMMQDLKTVTDKMSENEIENGIKKYGGGEQFLQAILLYFAFKAALIRKGVKVSLAAGAGAAIIFGTGTLCHSIASATGVAAIDDIANGIDIVGDLALNVADVGLTVAEEGIDFFGSIVEGIFSLFG